LSLYNQSRFTYHFIISRGSYVCDNGIFSGSKSWQAFQLVTLSSKRPFLIRWIGVACFIAFKRYWVRTFADAQVNRRCINTQGITRQVCGLSF
jgi:hypothetical protein